MYYDPSLESLCSGTKSVTDYPQIIEKMKRGEWKDETIVTFPNEEDCYQFTQLVMQNYNHAFRIPIIRQHMEKEEKK